MDKRWTYDDNYIAIGYLKLAMESFNRSVCNSEGDNLKPLTKQQMEKLVGCMHTSFDMYSEREAYDKA